VLLAKFGINDLIIDPGFGFAKTLETKIKVFKKMELLKYGIATSWQEYQKIYDL
jgi:dihydropteroate synthase